MECQQRMYYPLHTYRQNQRCYALSDQCCFSTWHTPMKEAKERAIVVLDSTTLANSLSNYFDASGLGLLSSVAGSYGWTDGLNVTDAVSYLTLVLHD